MFITDKVIEEMVNGYREILEEKREKIDDLFGDQADNKNRRVTISHTVNLSAKSETAIEIKDNANYILEPAIPAKKDTASRKRVIDTIQGKLPMGDHKDEQEDEE